SLLVPMAFGQQKVSLTIEQSIQLGLENSKALHSSLMKTQAADARSSEVHTQRLPTIKLGGSYTRLSEVPSFDLGPFPPLIPNRVTVSQSIFNNYNMRLTLQQPLFTGFRLQSSSDVAEYTAQATAEDYHRDKADLIYNVQTAYWSLYKANEFKKVIDENVDQVKAHLKDAQNFFAQGIVTKNEVLKIEVQLSNVQLLQLDAQNSVRLAMIALNNIIGLPLDTEIDLASSIQRQEKEHGEVNALIQKALNLRPEMKGMELRVKAGESALTLARSGWFPQIYLTGNYYYARPNQRVFPAEDQFKDTWDVSLSVSLDIWNWGTTIHQTNQAQAQLAQSQDALSQLRDGITLDVTQDYLNLNHSRERIAVAEKGVSQAEENYRITNEKFKSGVALNSDLLDAEGSLLQSKWSYIQALVDYELADARLQKAIGAKESKSPN
ncbi:MAG: TolC family protein, partial [Ignavibacteriales bacterium]|nr:TolC family protein [Ignavibacteriales bacterium]